MSAAVRQMRFNLFIHDTGHHEASWRLPESNPFAHLDIDYHENLARIAEAAPFESERVHTIDHVGRYFRIRGPLTLPRSPQGSPLLVQAGSSEDGKAFAAAHAEAMFTAQQTLEEATAFYADLKDRAAKPGRDQETVTILPGLVPQAGAAMSGDVRVCVEPTEVAQSG